MAKRKLILCPYCGNTQYEPEDHCTNCGGLFDTLSRKVTQQTMGPWFVRERRNPFRPGCSYDVLKRQIERGRIKASTILRGPTTRQFWTAARRVPGVGHLLGYCHECGEHVEPTDTKCPHCNASFRIKSHRDTLGLDPEDPNVLRLAQGLASGEIDPATLKKVQDDEAKKQGTTPDKIDTAGLASLLRPRGDSRSTPPKSTPASASSGFTHTSARTDTKDLTGPEASEGSSILQSIRNPAIPDAQDELDPDASLASPIPVSQINAQTSQGNSKAGLSNLVSHTKAQTQTPEQSQAPTTANAGGPTPPLPAAEGESIWNMRNVLLILLNVGLFAGIALVAYLLLTGQLGNS